MISVVFEENFNKLLLFHHFSILLNTGICPDIRTFRFVFSAEFARLNQ